MNSLKLISDFLKNNIIYDVVLFKAAAVGVLAVAAVVVSLLPVSLLPEAKANTITHCSTQTIRDWRFRKLALLVAMSATLRGGMWYISFGNGWNDGGRSSVRRGRADAWREWNEEMIREEHKRWKQVLLPVPWNSSDTSSPISWKPSPEWIGQCTRQLEHHVGNNNNKHKNNNPPFDNGIIFGYRLGDVIKSCTGQVPLAHPWASIEGKYTRLACPTTHPNYVQGGNLTIVQHILDEKQGTFGFTDVPPPNGVVIHLRLGDIVEGVVNASVAELLTTGATPWFHKGHVRSIQQYADDIQSAAAGANIISHVVIVGGSHTPKSDKSRPYAGCLYQALSLMGSFGEYNNNNNNRPRHYKTSLRMDHAGPDEDFFYMAHAKKIIVATGGYSALIGRMVQLNGGEIIGDDFDANALKL